MCSRLKDVKCVVDFFDYTLLCVRPWQSMADSNHRSVMSLLRRQSVHPALVLLLLLLPWQ